MAIAEKLFLLEGSRPNRSWMLSPYTSHPPVRQKRRLVGRTDETGNKQAADPSQRSKNPSSAAQKALAASFQLYFRHTPLWV